MATRVFHEDNSASRSLLISVCIGAVMYFGPRDANGSTTWFTFAAFGTALAVLWTVVLFQRFLFVRQLRRVSRASLAQILALTPDDQRERLKRALDVDTPLPDDGPIARFGYPLALRRSAQRIHWLVAGTVVLVLWQATVSASAPHRWLGVGIALAGLALLFARRRRDDLLSSVLEVSPFGIALSGATERRQAASWRDIPWIRIQMRRGFVSLQDSSQREVIRLDLDRLESYRALELIIQYGGYRFDQSAP